MQSAIILRQQKVASQTTGNILPRNLKHLSFHPEKDVVQSFRPSKLSSNQIELWSDWRHLDWSSRVAVRKFAITERFLNKKTEESCIHTFQRNWGNDSICKTNNGNSRSAWDACGFLNWMDIKFVWRKKVCSVIWCNLC